MKIYKAKIEATAELIVEIQEDANGDKEVVEVDDVVEVVDFDNVRPL